MTDDGGSTAEIVRVLGGPAVGDIRSRLLRLAPGNTREGRAVRRLLGHRLVGPQASGGALTHDEISRRAREEWLDVSSVLHTAEHRHAFTRGGCVGSSP